MHSLEGRCLLFTCALALTAATVSVARAGDERSPVDSFVVEAFVNVKRARTLDYLEAGLPALLAERLARHAPLRFVGGATLVERGAARGAKWIVGGGFDRRSDWKIAVSVEVRAASNGEVVARALRVGPKDDVVATALGVALEAFALLPGVTLAPATEAVTARFARDPYAFVLYGRALAAFAGLAGHGGGVERAMELCKRSLIIDPRVPEVRRFVGQVHALAGRPGHARAMWTYALDVRPDYLAALTALAGLDRAAGLVQARERYARVVELDPDDVEARRAHGELLSEAGEFVLAQAELEKVLALEPNDLRARRALALVLASRRAGHELAAELEEVVRLDPDSLEARIDLGAAYLGVGRELDAALVYEEVLRRRPRHSGALKLAADLARARGDLKKAATYYNKLRWLSPQDPRPVFLLGAAYFQAGNLVEAERLFTDGAQFPGMMGDAYSNLGAVELRRGRAREALWFLSRAAKKRPEKAAVRFNHALALHHLRRDADALNELRFAETADPGDAGVRFLAGVVSLRLGLLADAEKDFREALRLDPGHEDAKHNLAVLAPILHPRSETTLLFAP